MAVSKLPVAEAQSIDVYESIDMSESIEVSEVDEARIEHERPDRNPVDSAVPEPEDSLHIVVLGLSITSSWGNGHATTYRALVRALHERGHTVLFLERDVPWYASNRDLSDSDIATTRLYKSLRELKDRYASEVRRADVVIVGSYVPEGVEVGRWVIDTATGVTAFYDIDTPVTLAKLDAGDTEYIAADIIPRYDLYLSFAGGAVLDMLEQEYQAQAAFPLYCSVDPVQYHPESVEQKWALGYMGTYSEDRQPGLERLLMEPALAEPDMQFVVAGSQYPAEIEWASNITRIDHLPPAQHRRFYSQQRFTLNLTRAAMIEVGYSPSVRLFEAAACGTPIISDFWEGLETFFVPGVDILIARRAEEVQTYLRDLSETERQAIATRARMKVLCSHTASHRAYQLEQYVRSVRGVAREVVA